MHTPCLVKSESEEGRIANNNNNNATENGSQLIFPLIDACRSRILIIGDREEMINDSCCESA